MILFRFLNRAVSSLQLDHLCFSLKRHDEIYKIALKVIGWLVIFMILFS